MDNTYKLPAYNLLKRHKNIIKINAEELNETKNKIIKVLKDYEIGVSEIKATIGSTITLYEIVPEVGVKISKIEKLKDNIKLSLSELDTRIAVSIPNNRKTITIEVPNKTPSIVSMYPIISSEKFHNNNMELPIALGKTIENQTYIFDLTKASHLLFAGNNHQENSIGINVVLTSFLYKKQPNEIEFVLIDTKKELTLYNKIEHHFLAKLPNEKNAIISDTDTSVKALNSLCIEMDNRFERLKKLMCRNIIDYNLKIRDKKLETMPYIVVVINDFGDLIKKAGKDIEKSIIRLAQLSRGVGIHLVIATEYCSENVITDLVKENFSTKITFQVKTARESKIILDEKGAEKLIGNGDMLIKTDTEIKRLQCSYIDNTEIDEVTRFISSQNKYSEEFLLPENTAKGDVLKIR